MGIQINGNTNNINAGIGSLSIEDINELDIVGVATAANFKTGVSNLHSVGLTLSGGQIDVGSNIKIGTAGVVTATSFVGSGANLTSLPAQATIANNADNRVITGGSGVNLNGEANLTFDGSKLAVNRSSDGSIVQSYRTGNTSGGGTELRVTDGYSSTVPLYAFWYNNNTGIGNPAANTTSFIQNSSEKLRITSSGQLLIGTTSGGGTLRVFGGSGRLIIGDSSVNYHDADTHIFRNYASTEKLRINSNGHMILSPSGYSLPTSDERMLNLVAWGNKAASIGFQRSNSLGGSTCGWTNELQSNGDLLWGVHNVGEKLRITSGGVIQCGTSGSLQAFINNSVSGHQFISQCDDNNNGFEVYQKHGSSTTRNTFAVYANTGSGGAKNDQFSVRGDGTVTVNGDFDFDKFTPDGTITTTLSSSSSSGNYTTIIPLNTSGIGHLHVYLVSIHWSFNSNGGAPYYCSGAVLWQTPHSNQNNGVGYPYEMLSSCHIGGNYYLKIRNITGGSAYPGLQAANVGWTAQAGSHYIVKYKRIY